MLRATKSGTSAVSTALCDRISGASPSLVRVARLSTLPTKWKRQ